MSTAASKLLPPPMDPAMSAMFMAGPLKMPGPNGTWKMVPAPEELEPPVTAKQMESITARARNAERQAGGPFKEVGFRNLGTGEVIGGGDAATHFRAYGKIPEGHRVMREGYTPENALQDPPEKVWEEGFITPEDRFLTRREAAKLVNKGVSIRGGLFEAPDQLHTVDPESGFANRISPADRSNVPEQNFDLLKQLRKIGAK